jgi:hypothetical protein
VLYIRRALAFYKVRGDKMKNKVKKYQKRPIIVEAIQLSLENWKDICEFIPGNYLISAVSVNKDGKYSYDCMKFEKIGCIIKTLEGNMLAVEGDYIIKGINGEYYPCKPDIFEKTYTEVK